MDNDTILATQPEPLHRIAVWNAASGAAFLFQTGFLLLDVQDLGNRIRAAWADTTERQFFTWWVNESANARNGNEQVQTDWRRTVRKRYEQDPTLGVGRQTALLEWIMEFHKRQMQIISPVAALPLTLGAAFSQAEAAMMLGAYFVNGLREPPLPPPQLLSESAQTIAEHWDVILRAGRHEEVLLAPIWWMNLFWNEHWSDLDAHWLEGHHVTRWLASCWVNNFDSWWAAKQQEWAVARRAAHRQEIPRPAQPRAPLPGIYAGKPVYNLIIPEGSAPNQAQTTYGKYNQPFGMT